MQVTGDELSIDKAIDFLVQNRKYLDEQQLERLNTELRASLTLPSEFTALGDDPNVDEENLTLLSELEEQLKMVRHLRQIIRSRGEDVTTRELKDLISTSSSLFSTLTKLHEQALNQDRIRRIENAVVKAIESLEPRLQEAFFLDLEEKLAE